MAERVLRSAVAVCALATCAMAVAAPVLARGLDGSPGLQYDVLHAWDTLVPTVYVLTGAALVWLRPRNVLGWLLVAGGASAMTGTLLGVYGTRALVRPEAGLPAGDLALSMAAWLWLPGLFLLPTLLPLLYPSGHLPSPRWRLAVVATGIGLASLAVAAAFSVETVDDFVADARPPLVLPDAVQVPLTALGLSLLAVTAMACVANAAWRLWRAQPPERAQLAWLLTTATAATVLAIVGTSEFVFLLALAAVPVAVVLGVLRYGLLDIEVVLRPALLYGLLTVLVAMVFAGLTTALSSVLPAGPLPTFVAAAVVAVGIAPAHTRLRRFVSRLVDGPAADPLAAMSDVGRAVAGAGDTGPVSRVLASVAEAVGAARVTIRDPRGGVLAQYGDGSARPVIDVPLTYAGEQLGTLQVAGNRHGLTETGRALLAALAPQVAVVVRATALNAELEDARRHVVDAALGERNRLRRDLHDGLGPSLSGVALGLEAGQTALHDDPGRTGEILDRLRTEVRGAVEDVRRILDGLRPSRLDALGLVGALREQASDHGDGLAVDVAADGGLPPMDPDVEAAAYRIALEAVTNARRHARATHCTVRLSATDGQLRVEVHDDGQGLPPTPQPGVGLVSMRHRAESLGGALDVRSSSSGTTVLARLPRQRS